MCSPALDPFAQRTIKPKTLPRVGSAKSTFRRLSASTHEDRLSVSKQPSAVVKRSVCEVTAEQT